MARILIIDADQDGRELVARLVEQLGHEIVGPQDTASGPGPDLAIVDPADPAALAEAQRLHEERDLLPIVCASSARPTDEVEALEPTAFLAKPLRARLIDWAIADALALEPVLVAA